MTDTQKINELRRLIIKGNRETDRPHLPREGAELYEHYWKQLIGRRNNRNKNRLLLLYILICGVPLP